MWAVVLKSYCDVTEKRDVSNGMGRPQENAFRSDGAPDVLDPRK